MKENKTTKIALLIVAMLIITITSVISTLATQELLMDSKNDEQEILVTDTSSNQDNLE